MHASDASSPAGPRPGSSVRRTVERVQVRAAEVARRRGRDALAAEEPLEIRVATPDGGMHPIAVTMRTPGSDFELAAGFLYSEGVIGPDRTIAGIRYCVDAARDGPQRYNIVQVLLRGERPLDLESLRRNFYATSSCGVCGKASIDAVLGAACDRVSDTLTVPAAALVALPERLRAEQPLFDRTGGLHAAALFDREGSILRIREDVGRHNAMDKLVGSALLAGELPLSGRGVLVSGRLSFELVQKAARAGAALLAGVSAPSSLAVELAERAGITLVGFLRGGRFNVYCGGERIADG